MRVVNFIALLLVVIGAINWGLIGFFGVDAVSSLFGGHFQYSRIVFALVGLAGLWALTFFKHCCCCNLHRDRVCHPKNGSNSCSTHDRDINRDNKL